MPKKHEVQCGQQLEKDSDLFFNHSSDLLVVSGFDGVIKRVNPSFQKILGWNAQEIEGKHWQEFVHPSDKADNLFFEDVPIDRHYKTQFRCKEGTFRVISWTQTVLKDEKMVLGIGRDITETSKIEESLKEKEEKCRHLLQYAPAGIYEIDCHANKFLCVNDAMCELTGYTREELLAKKPTAILTFKSKKLFKEKIRKITSGQIDENVDFKLKVKDGREIWCNLNFKPVLKDDKIDSVFIIGYDITERREAEEKLLEIQEQLAAILENVDNGFISLDMDWRFSYLNSRAAHNFGFEPYQLIGKSIWETFPEIVGSEAEKNYRKVMEWRVSVTFEVKGVLTDRLYEEKVYPTVSGIAIFWTDITERKRSEDELRRTRTYLENLLNYANAPIIVWDSNLKVTLFNRAFEYMTGFFASDVLGEPLDSLFPVDEKQKAMNQIKRAINGEFLESVEIPIIRKDGTKKLALWNSANIYDTEKKILATIAQGQDITQRKKAEDELRKKTIEVEKYTTHLEALAAERLKQLKDAERLAAIGQTAGMVGHDLRNPLQSIVGEVYLAKTEIETLPECQQKCCLKENIDAIADQIDYMDKIVSDLQTFVKPVEIHKKHINLNQFIEALFAQVNIPQNVNVIIDLGRETLTLETDPQLLKRVLINLVTNAFQAMPEGGELTLKAHKTSKNQIEIIVQDSGVGVPDEIKPKLFTPLFTTKSKGQGFGLAVCKRVIEAQGGVITFESQFGKGTKFTINYPLV